MENYNIYDEIGRGQHSYVYKARRKRSIEYVAVKSTEKERMSKILNEVQFLHKLNSSYVLKFHNWYESSNHIWIIFEFCIGGDLLNLITQDKSLPESSIKCFGYDLLMGLQYLHLNGVIYCDLKPANVLIDEYGCLKLSDFGLARKIPTEESILKSERAPGSPHYMAPELFEQQPIHSFASDFWALGCVLYELRTGVQPFSKSGFVDLKHMIQTTTLEIPPKHTEMSSQLCHLLERIFDKDPSNRITWQEILQHPFWDKELEEAVPSFPEQSLFDIRYPSHVPRTNHDSIRENYPDRLSIKNSTTTEPLSQREKRLSIGSNTSNSTTSADSEPSIQTRPTTAPPPRVKTVDETPQIDEPSSVYHFKNPPKTAPVTSRPKKLERPVPNGMKMRLYTPADCVVKPIVGCNDIEMVAMPRVKESSLPFPTDPPPSSQEEIENQLEKVYNFLKSDAATADKHNALAYLYSISMNSKCANIIVNSTLLSLLIELLENSSSSAMKSRLCLVLSVIVRHATYISPDICKETSQSGLLQVLPMILTSDHDNAQISRRAMACLGELAFYMTSQSQKCTSPVVESLIHGLNSTDSITCHYAAQTICNILAHTSDGNLISPWIQVEVVTSVLEQYRRVESTEAFRLTMIQTLSQILKHLLSMSPSQMKLEIFEQVCSDARMLWEEMWSHQTNYRWVIATLNSLNSILSIDSLNSTIRPFLNSIESLDGVRSLLERREHEESGTLLRGVDTGRFKDFETKLTNLVYGKLILFLHYGLQISRNFAILFVEADLLNGIDSFLTSNDTSPSKIYASCAAQELISLVIRISLELTYSQVDEKDVMTRNLMKNLLLQLLRDQNSRQYFILHLLAGENRLDCQDFISGLSNLLESQASTSIIEILLLLFQNGDIVTNQIEIDQLWFRMPLVSLSNFLNDSSLSPDILVNCIRLIYSSLEMFPQSSFSDEFIVQSLLPSYHTLLDPKATDESVRRFAVELLHDIIQRDLAFVSIIVRLNLLEHVIGIITHTMSTCAAKVLLFILQSDEIQREDLYAFELPKKISTTLLTCHQEEQYMIAEDLCDMMYMMLYEQYALIRAKGKDPVLELYSTSHEVFIICIDTLLQLSIPPLTSNRLNEENGCCDKSSRCFAVLCQLYPQHVLGLMNTTSNGLFSLWLNTLIKGTKPVRLRSLQAFKYMIQTVDPFPHFQPHDMAQLKHESIRSKKSLTLKDFDVKTLIGSGLLGHVYVVQHRSSKKYFAMKSIWKSDVIDRKMVRHVFGEKDAMEHLKHPFLVECIETFQSEEQLHFVLEYVPGGELFKWLHEFHYFFDHEAKFFATEILLAMESIHQMGFIYRDIKPENILLDAHGHIKIVDFGFAKPLEMDGRCSTIVGTPQYLAPEQLKKGSAYDRTVDWWAFGCLVYELLMGRTPFFRSKHDTHFEIYTRIARGKISFNDRVTRHMPKVGGSIYTMKARLVSLDLIRQLLKPQLSKRLIEPAKMKNHPWFADVDWDSIAEKRIVPPIHTQVRAPGDCSNFSPHDEPNNPCTSKPIDASLNREFIDF